MGRTFMRKPENLKAWLHNALSFDEGSDRKECLDVAIVDRTEAYAAVKRTNTFGVSDTYCVIVKMTFHPNASVPQETFSYQAFSEGELEHAISCPLRILDLLTPTEDKRANEWREQCKARLERRWSNRRIKDGDYIKFDHPVVKVGNRTYDTLRIRKNGNHVSFDVIAETGECMSSLKLSRWRERHFRVLEWDEIPTMERYNRKIKKDLAANMAMKP